jgi:hypothetical protein
MNAFTDIAVMMNKIADKGLLFNVSTSRVMTDHGVVHGKKAIVNDETKETLGIVSSGYKVVSNAEIFESFAESIVTSKLDTTDMEVNVLSTPTRSRSIVDFTFPAERFQVDHDASATALSITALNSYDGSTRFVAKAGGLRIKCMNGQIIGNIAGSYSSTHTKSLDVGTGAQRVMQMIQDFQSSKEYFGQMMARRIELYEAREVLLRFLNLDVNAPESRHNKRFIKLMSRFIEYTYEMGLNVYALYNCLTDYVSHATPRNADTAAVNALNNRRKLEKYLASEEMFS